MDNKKIKEFLDEIILDKFLINFIPGIILFYVLLNFINVSTGQGLTSLLIITSISWVLGLLIELVVFRKIYINRRKEIRLSINEKLNLLYGKIGISILIACVSWINLEWFLDLFDNRNIEEMKVINMAVKFSLFFISGLSLYLYYLKNNIRNK